MFCLNGDNENSKMSHESCIQKDFTPSFQWETKSARNMHSETPCIMGLYVHNQLHAVQVKPLTKNINGTVVESCQPTPFLAFKVPILSVLNFCRLPTYCLPSPQSATSSSLFPSPCRLLTYCLLALKVLYYNPLQFNTISRYKRLSQLSFPLMLLWIRKQECFPDCSIHRLDLLEVNMITFGIQDTHVKLSFARNKGLNNNV